MKTTQVQNLARKTLLKLVEDDYFIEYLQKTLDETLKEEGVEPDQLDENGLGDYIEILNAAHNLIHEAAQTK